VIERTLKNSSFWAGAWCVTNQQSKAGQCECDAVTVTTRQTPADKSDNQSIVSDLVEHHTSLLIAGM
jgi:hypothetical protein